MIRHYSNAKTLLRGIYIQIILIFENYEIKCVHSSMIVFIYTYVVTSEVGGLRGFGVF